MYVYVFLQKGPSRGILPSSRRRSPWSSCLSSSAPARLSVSCSAPSVCSSSSPPPPPPAEPSPSSSSSSPLSGASCTPAGLAETCGRLVVLRVCALCVFPLMHEMTHECVLSVCSFRLSRSRTQTPNRCVLIIGCALPFSPAQVCVVVVCVFEFSLMQVTVVCVFQYLQ